MRVESATLRRQTVVEAVLLYYSCVSAGQRTRVLEGALTNLEEASRVLAARREAGTASQYENKRLEVATQLAKSRAAEAAGEQQASLARLAASLGVSASGLEVGESLALEPLPNKGALLARAAGGGEPMRWAQIATRAAGEAKREARFSWFPDLAVFGGMKRVSAVQEEFGYVMGLSLELPVFDSGQALRAESGAFQKLSEARVAALSAFTRGQVESLFIEYEAARHNLEQFDLKTSRSVGLLLVAARSGYREGERTILELLDAQTLQTEVSARRLSLLLSAKQGEAKLRALMGEFE
jgi:outer membrane protein TolC